MLAARGAQREQALLDLLQALVATGELMPRALKGGIRLGQLDAGAIEGRDRRFKRVAGTLKDPLDHAPGAAEPTLDATLVAQQRQCLADRGRELLAVHQAGAQRRQRLLLVRLRRQRVELGQDMAQIVLLRGGMLQLRRDLGTRPLQLAPACMREAQLRDCFLEATVSVEQATLDRRVEQPLLLVLAVHLDQQAADLAHQAGADRLVVDEAARATVGADHAAQHQVVLRRDAVLGEQCLDRIARRGREHGADACLRGAPTHQIAVRPAAQRQSQGIEQDRLAGAGLAGQHAKAGLEREVEPLDQDDVADREAGQHWRGAIAPFDLSSQGRPIRPHSGHAHARSPPAILHIPHWGSPANRE